MISRAWLVVSALAVAGCASTTPPAVETAISPRLGCEALARTALPDPTTTITEAVMRPAAPVQAGAAPGPPPTATPEHCEILGKLQERQGANGQTYAIKFHLRLPARWNGRFFFRAAAGPMA